MHLTLPLLTSTTQNNSVIIIPLSDRVYVTEFSPFHNSQELLALGLQSSVVVVSIRFCEQDETIDGYEYSIIKKVCHPYRVQSLAWSPRSSINMLPKCLEFATSGSDHVIRLFSIDLSSGVDECRFIGKHDDYINSVAFEPTSIVEPRLATASDDHNVRIWNLGITNSTCMHSFKLNSPAMSVIWHHSDTSKLLVAEKNGAIHIFNSVSYRPIMSVDCGMTAQLSSADWCASNSRFIVAAVGSDWILWDLNQPSTPLAWRRYVHADGTRYVKFANYVFVESGTTDAILGSVGQPDYSVKVSMAKSSQSILSISGHPVGGISWHYRLAYMAVGNDSKVSIYKFPYTY